MQVRAYSLVSHFLSDKILFVTGHDSSIHFATFSASAAPVVQVVKTPELPYCALLALSERAVVGNSRHNDFGDDVDLSN